MCSKNKLLLLCVLIIIEYPHILYSQKITAQQATRTVINLTALAKVLGYVRYFYPQDNASLDWNNITIYGVRQVINCADDNDLRAQLQNILKPIAERMTISDSVDVNKDDQLQSIGCNSPGSWKFWQHKGPGLNNIPGHSIYVSALVNGPDSRDIIPNGMSEVFPTTDASIVGHQFNMKLFFRSDAVIPDSTFILYFKANRDRILLKKPFKILQNKSEKIGIVSGVFNELADMLTISLNLTNINSLSIDSVCMVELNDKRHERILMSDDFKALDKDGFPENWNFTGHGYTYSFANAVNQARVLNIVNNSPILANTLFANYPKNGETIISKISPTLYCKLPLTLCNISISEAQFGIPANANNVDKQNDRLYKNLAAIIVAWNLINNFYPYFDVLKIDWDAELSTTLQQALSTTNQYDFLRVINKMIAKIKDGHASVGWQPPMQFRLPFQVDWVQEKATVVAVDSGVEDIKIGDAILSIDSVASDEIIHQEEECISGSAQYIRYRAMQSFAYGRVSDNSIVKIQRSDSIVCVKVSKHRLMAEEFQEPISVYPSKKNFGDSVFYYDLSKVDFSEIRSNITQLTKAKGIIFDMRNRPTDAGIKILPYLLSSVDTCNWMHIPLIIYPDHKNMNYFDDIGWHLSPATPHINAKIAFITNSSTISYPESVLIIVAHYKLGAIISETATAGTDGDMSTCVLPGGYPMFWTGMKVTNLDGSQFHTIGVQPTIKVMRAINSIKQGVDDLMVAALKYVNN